LVDVAPQGREVLWTNTKGLHLHFDREQYDSVVASAREDISWEDSKRTAERLVSGVLTGALLDEGYTFDWASARVRGGVMTISFSKCGTQKLFEFAWDGYSAQDALAGAKRFQKERVEPGGRSQ
jgi:hypothetical protein